MIDDWLGRPRKTGQPPRLSHAEPLTIPITQALLGILSGARWLSDRAVLAVAVIASASSFAAITNWLNDSTIRPVPGPASPMVCRPA